MLPCFVAPIFSFLPFYLRFVAAGADAFPKHSGLTASVKGFLKLSLVSRGKKRRIARFWFMVVHRPKAVPKVCFVSRQEDLISEN